jgi:DNA-binding SARP family transcriptional activator/tetratricopeptide (TPR) repeat protein
MAETASDSTRVQTASESTRVQTASESTRVQLCGRLSVEIDGVHIEDRLRGRQVRLLLAYMVLNRTRAIGREELVEALWPREAPVSKDAALRTLLSRLRAAVGGDALTGRDELALALPEPAWIDLEAAAAELQRANDALGRGDARGAWALAQVPLNIAGRGLLPGHQASWLEPPRRELEETRLAALEVIGAAGLRMGTAQLGSVERSARALIETEPYRESGYVMLMGALAMRGNVAEGLRVFESLRSLLRDELGTSPSPEALAAHERLLHPRGSSAPPSTPAPPAASGVALPAELRDRAQSPLVGRKAELTELRRLWDPARTGVPAEPGAGGPLRHGSRQIVVLSGDAGIGKTSLAAQLAGEAHSEGAVVLAGRSQEEGIAPYQPFLEALRHYFASAPEDHLVPAVREYGAELARLIPELRRRVPELEEIGPSEPEIERYRLFEAVVGLLRGIAVQAPIMLVLDDLHWADQPTLLLLRHLARAREPARLLILVAYRSERLNPGLLDMLAELRRDRLLASIEIGGLSERETAELVRQRTGEAPSHALTRALHAETEGSPFFIEEIARNLVGAGVRVSEATAADLASFAVPEGVKQVVATRLSRLAPGTVEWLRVASVIGREFDIELLEQVVDMGEEEFLGALEESLGAALLLEADASLGSERYGFAHALIRDAIYEGMSAPRRARLHRRVGEALEASGAAPVQALALHFTRAADADNADKAVAYARAAAEQANEQLAYDEAGQHYARALEVLNRFRPAAEERPDLLCSLGEALVRAGERPRASDAFREAAALARRAGDGGTLARAAIGASRRYVQQPGVVEGELIELLEAALEMTSDEISLTRVRLIVSLCAAISYTPERGRMQELAARAERLAEQLADPHAHAYANSARRRALWQPGLLRERLVAATEMLRLAREAGDRELELQAHGWLVVDLLEAGDVQGVDAQIAAFREGAEQLRQPLYLWQIGVWEAMLAFLRGELVQAEELAGEALAAGTPSETRTAPQYFAFQLFALRREQRRTGETEELVRRMVAEYGTRGWRAVHATLLADLGRTEEAAEELEQLATEQVAEGQRGTDWLVWTALMAEPCAAVGGAGMAVALRELLESSADINLVAGLGAVCLGPIRRLTGNLALVAGDKKAAVAELEQALESATRLGSPLWQAHTQLDLAAALGHGLRASRLIDDAADTAEEAGLARVADRVDRLRHR